MPDAAVLDEWLASASDQHVLEDSGLAGKVMLKLMWGIRMLLVLLTGKVT